MILALISRRQNENRFTRNGNTNPESYDTSTDSGTLSGFRYPDVQTLVTPVLELRFSFFLLRHKAETYDFNSVQNRVNRLTFDSQWIRFSELKYRLRASELLPYVRSLFATGYKNGGKWAHTRCSAKT